MEALVIIFGGVIALIILFAIVVWGYFIIVTLSRIIYIWLPIILGGGGGLYLWGVGDKTVGNILVAVGLIGGIFWIGHLATLSAADCNCIIHKPLNFLRELAGIHKHDNW